MEERALDAERKRALAEARIHNLEGSLREAQDELQSSQRDAQRSAASRWGVGSWGDCLFAALRCDVFDDRWSADRGSCKHEHHLVPHDPDMCRSQCSIKMHATSCL